MNEFYDYLQLPKQSYHDNCRFSSAKLHRNLTNDFPLSVSSDRKPQLWIIFEHCSRLRWRNAIEKSLKNRIHCEKKTSLQTHFQRNEIRNGFSRFHFDGIFGLFVFTFPKRGVFGRIVSISNIDISMETLGKHDQRILPFIVCGTVYIFSFVSLASAVVSSVCAYMPYSNLAEIVYEYEKPWAKYSLWNSNIRLSTNSTFHLASYFASAQQPTDFGRAVCSRRDDGNHEPSQTYFHIFIC